MKVVILKIPVMKDMSAIISIHTDFDALIKHLDEEVFSDFADLELKEISGQSKGIVKEVSKGKVVYKLNEYMWDCSFCDNPHRDIYDKFYEEAVPKIFGNRKCYGDFDNIIVEEVETGVAINGFYYD
jgi:hypothetical protein